MTSAPLLTLTVQPRYHEIDPLGAVRLPIILSWLQDAGSTHAQQLGVALKELKKIGLTWVLSRLNLQMHRYPRCNEQITVQTWPATREGLFSIRDYRLFDANGINIANATSSWAVLNLKTRRPVRIADHLPHYPLRPERAIEDPFATLPVLGNSESEIELPVLRADLDQNHHVNNTVYAGWGLEAVPSAIADHFRPSGIEIGFRAEALYNDRIISRCSVIEQGEQPCLLHRIEHAADGRELARLRTRWTRISTMPKDGALP